jgi:hypothetical protein
MIDSPTYHNAGHAAATALIEVERERDGGCDDAAHKNRWNAEYEAMTALGGVVAERMFLGKVEPNGATNDIANAFRHVGALTSIPGEQAAYVALLNARVEYLLERHRDFVAHVASAIASTGRAPNDIAREDVARFVTP